MQRGPIYLFQKEIYVIISLPLKTLVTIVLRELRGYLLIFGISKKLLKNTRIKKLKSKSRPFLDFGSDHNISSMTVHDLTTYTKSNP